MPARARDVEQVRTRPDSPYRFVILGFLGLANIFNSVIALSLGILLPSISDDLGLSPSEQGWLGSSALLGNLVLALPASAWLSRFNSKMVLEVTLFLGAVFVFAQGWAPAFVALILGRLAFGLVMVARTPARAILTAQWFPPREIVVVNGIVNSTYGLAAVIGLVLTPFLLLWLDNSWRATLTVYGIIFLVIAIAWVFMGKERNIEGPRRSARLAEGSPLRSLLRYRELWYISIGMFGTTIMWSGLAVFWPTLMLDTYDIPLTISGSVLSLAAVAEAIGSILLAIYLMRVVKRDMRKFLVAGLGTLLVASAVGLVLTGSIPLLVFLAIFHGIGFSFVPIIWTVPFELPGIKPREIAVASGLIEMALRGGGVVGPILAGFLHEATGDLSLALVVTSLCGLSIVAVALMRFGKGYERVPVP
ncbi:MAG: MFS transporter [Dehalococcoidia bacterium]